MATERTVEITVSLFDGADRLARRRGVPRSRLYAEALRRYVDEDSESLVTRQLDEMAAEMDTAVDPVVKELQRRALAGMAIFLPRGAAGLPDDAVANVTQVRTEDRSDLGEQLGKLDATLLQRVDAGLRRALGL